MKHKKQIFGAILMLGLGLSGLQAQEAIVTAGGNASGSGGSVSYTVGQLVYTVNTGSNGSVAQTIQQPYEILVLTALEEVDLIDFECMVYPNPANDILTLKVDASTTLNIQSMNLQLYNTEGKLIVSKKLSGNETEINMTNLVPANYILKVISDQQDIKTFKIIKD